MGNNFFERAKEILLVEDSATDTKMVLRALAKSERRMHVSAVVDGEEALLHLRQDPHAPLPDLILLDLNLPRKDGWEVLAECKADPRLKQVPIVIFTTSQLGSEVQRCYEMGANSFVAKPFEMDQFMTTVRRIEDYWLETSAPTL
jgi:chemotaxis family two-component system response regulator Rcp1